MSIFLVLLTCSCPTQAITKLHTFKYIKNIQQHIMSVRYYCSSFWRATTIQWLNTPTGNIGTPSHISLYMNFEICIWMMSRFQRGSMSYQNTHVSRHVTHSHACLVSNYWLVCASTCCLFSWPYTSWHAARKPICTSILYTTHKVRFWSKYSVPSQIIAQSCFMRSLLTPLNFNLGNVMALTISCSLFAEEVFLDAWSSSSARGNI